MKHVLPVTIEAHQFVPREFVGGDAALDFVNTVTGRDQVPRDWLDGYDRLLDWAAIVHLLPDRAVSTLRRMAHHDAVAAGAALGRAKALREALFSIVGAIASGQTPAAPPLALLNDHWIAGAALHELQIQNGQILVRVRADCAEFDSIASLIAYRMVEYVLPSAVGRLHVCQGPNCSWVFLDVSKAGRRRWCDMAVCGNAAKSRRFHARARRNSSR